MKKKELQYRFEELPCRISVDSTSGVDALDAFCGCRNIGEFERLTEPLSIVRRIFN